jgi:hypothetical protein
MARATHLLRKTDRWDAQDRRLAELQSTVFSAIGKPIEDATVADVELLGSVLSQKDTRAINEYARQMQTAIGAPCLTSRAKAHNRNKDEQLGIRIDSWLKTSLEELAERDELSVAQLVRQVLKDFVSYSSPLPKVTDRTEE